VPDSIGDFLLKIVCKSDFPNGKNTDDYFSVENPIKATEKIKAELLKNSK
jgi:hypothetical protein